MWCHRRLHTLSSFVNLAQPLDFPPPVVWEGCKCQKQSICKANQCAEPSGGRADPAAICLSFCFERTAELGLWIWWPDYPCTQGAMSLQLFFFSCSHWRLASLSFQAAGTAVLLCHPGDWWLQHPQLPLSCSHGCVDPLLALWRPSVLLLTINIYLYGGCKMQFLCVLSVCDIAHLLLKISSWLLLTAFACFLQVLCITWLNKPVWCCQLSGIQPENILKSVRWADIKEQWRKTISINRKKFWVHKYFLVKLKKKGEKTLKVFREIWTYLQR